MNVEQAIEHILSQQAGHDARIQLIEEKQVKNETLVHQLIGLMSQLAKETRETRKDVREIREAQKKTDAQLRELTKEVKSLSAAVRMLVSRNGRKN